MKFYYNDKLIRTSKTHEYKYALISSTGKCVTCSASRERAEAELASWINRYNEKIQNYKSIIHAIEIGASHYNAIDGRKTYRVKLAPEGNDGHTIKGAKEYLEEAISRLEEIKKCWKVVELEARA